MQHNAIITANRVIYQEEIFPELEEKFGYLTNKHEQFIQMLDLIDINAIYPRRLWDAFFGRPVSSRHSFVRAFMAKIIWGIDTTKDLIERLKVDRVMRCTCMFDYRVKKLPSESSFSRAFKELSELDIASKIHEYLIIEHCSSELYEHTSIDGSSIEVAEKAVIVEKKIRTTQDQLGQTTQEILEDLPDVCNFGAKKDSNGKGFKWKGYKLHAAVNDYNIPIAAVVTSASVNDTLCAIPLVRIVEQRVDNLYYLMDKGYDSAATHAEVKSHGKVALIDFNHRGNEKDARSFDVNEKRHYGNRAFSESFFSHLKMQYLPNYILYRGIKKVTSVLNFALSVITAVQIVKYA